MGVCIIEGCENKSVCRKMCHKHYSRWKRHGDHNAAINPHAPPEERFWRFVRKGAGCWLWTGYLNSNGYGRIALPGRGRMETASRFSYRLHKGDPSGFVVMHTCDNPACVNPSHLVLGTQKENVADMIAKRRGNWRCPSGEGNPNSRLTEDAVREIRTSAAQGKALAEKFGVATSTISDIRKRRIWKHID